MPITIAEIPEETRKLLEKIWKERHFKIGFPEFLALYVWAYNRAEELGFPSPSDYVIESLDYLDPELSYEELKAQFELRGISEAIPTEIEELEYWKKRAEELEKEIERLGGKEKEELEAELKKWKSKYEELKKTFEKVKETKGLTEEDVMRIVKEQLKQFALALKPILSQVIKAQKEKEKKEVYPATTEEAYEEWGPPAPFHSREVPPTGSQLTSYIKDILALMYVKAKKEYGKNVDELTEKEVMAICKQLYPSYPRQVSYFLWWYKRLPSWREWWRRSLGGEFGGV